MNQLIKKSIELRGVGEILASIELLKEIIVKDPNNAQANYQCAWGHDVLGKEVEAIPYYEKAIANKLEGKELEGAYLGLGSTYRTIGEYSKSKNLFEKAISIFTDNLELQVFYAMTLYNLKEYNKAMELLLKIIATTSMDENINAYKKAILFYSDKLDDKFI